MNIISAANPKWADAAQTRLDLDLTTEEFGVIPFTAAAHESVGADLIARAIAGEFGSIAPAPPPPPPTPEQIVAALTRDVQAHLDATARTRNYDGILSLCSYAASTNPTFSAEGLAGVAWRDAVWAACYAIMAAVQAGTRAVPTTAALLAELPPMAWPA
ncbi:MAG: hypothetical protein U0932_14630 [Thiobacillus sp.]|nr:hypothetical protein [Thiobacillus sp.]